MRGAAYPPACYVLDLKSLRCLPSLMAPQASISVAAPLIKSTKGSLWVVNAPIILMLPVRHQINPRVVVIQPKVDLMFLSSEFFGLLSSMIEFSLLLWLSIRSWRL